MRFDSHGLFWNDIERESGKSNVARVMPPIPNTGWQRIKDFPNLSGVDVISLDLETYDPEFVDYGPGWARHKGHIVGASLGTKDGHRWYFPMRHTIEPEWNLDPIHVTSFLRDTLQSKYLRAIVGANLTYDLGWCAEETIYDYWVRRPNLELIDVQFAEALLDESSFVRLGALASRYLGEHKKGDIVFQWCSDYYGGKPNDSQRANLWRSPPRLTGPYAEGDADLPLRLAPIMYEHLERENLLDNFRLQCKLIPILIAMRMCGVTVDVKKAEEVKAKLVARIAIEVTKINSIAGFDLNTGSGPQMAKAFDNLGIPYPRTEPTEDAPDGNPSFVKAWLEKLDHPIGHHITEKRRLEKVANTFLQSYIIDSNVSNKIYATFHPLKGEDGGTKVNRFSGSDPNLQNVPIRDEELGHLIRSIFTPDEGHRWWTKFDFSQIQYRSLVHWAVGPGSDEARARYCLHPETDYHKLAQELVEKVFGVRLPRRPIKNINFGLSFGMGIEKLLHDIIHFAHSEMEKHPELRTILTKLATKEGAMAFLEAYHKAMPFAKPTIKYFSDLAGKQGYLTSIDGFKSRFDLWEPKKWGEQRPALPYDQALQTYGSIRRAMVHKALNRQLQMDEGSIMKRAIVEAWETGVYDVIGVPRILVHDEFGHSHFEGPYVEEGYQEFARIATQTTKLRVPIVIERETVNNWGDCK